MDRDCSSIAVRYADLSVGHSSGVSSTVGAVADGTAQAVVDAAVEADATVRQTQTRILNSSTGAAFVPLVSTVASCTIFSQ